MGLKNAGGLWLKEGKKGKFLSGSFEPQGKGGPKFQFMAFKNEDKDQNPKAPDYRIVMTEDEFEEKPRGVTGRQASQADDVMTDDDVPF